MRNYQQLLTRGDHLYETADYGQAAQVYGRAVDLAPQRKEAYVKLGLLYTDCGDTAAAAGFFRKAADLDPADAFARLNLGLGLYGAGRLPEAAEQLQAAVRLIESGVAKMRAGSDDAAVRAQCAELEETAAQARVLLQEIAAAPEDRQTPQGQQASEEPPHLQRYEALLAEGERLTKEGRYDRAAQVYREGIALMPEDTRACRQLATVLGVLGDRTRAVDLFRSVVARDASDCVAHLNLGTLLNLEGQREEALGHLRKAADLAGGSLARLRNLDTVEAAEAEALAKAITSLQDVQEKAGQRAEEVTLRLRFAEAAERSSDPAVFAEAEERVRSSRRLRLGVLITLWKRHGLADLVLARCQAVRQGLAPLMDLELFAVGSEGEASRTLAERNGFHYLERPNDPLGAKRNDGLAALEAHDLDAVVFVDSDDFVNEQLFVTYAAGLHAGYAFLGIRDMFMFDLASLRACYWPGYGMEGGRLGEPLGLGRCIRRDLLEGVGWRLWEDGRNNRLDSSMIRCLAPLLVAQPEHYPIGVFSCSRHGIRAVDVKSIENIWSFDEMAQSREGMEYRAPARFLSEHFSPEEARRLLALSSEAQHLADLLGAAPESSSLKNHAA